ncbi:MAG TPA: endonuclease III [Candidatus Atribacteria bacterium]|nr:endonuclease III [Candidatus Atribacteria bacterium]HPU08491.1 endonuclease III [Candidatus Atribacteria bacterium]
MEEKERVAKILDALEKRFPDARLLLEFRNPFELLVATILAAQAPDERVNQVTKTLFQRFPTPRDLSSASLSEIEQIIQSLPYYRQKARFLKEASSILVEKFQGEVPPQLEALTSLPGVGRKTANIVLANAFNIPAIAVDTHVARVSQRLGLTSSSSPLEIEKDLTQIIPPEQWIRATHLLSFLGRTTCSAKKPRCPECPVREWCPSFTSF